MGISNDNVIATLDLEADANIILLKIYKRFRLTGKNDVCARSYDATRNIVKI